MCQLVLGRNLVLRSCFGMKLVFESVGWEKQIAYPHMNVICLNHRGCEQNNKAKEGRKNIFNRASSSWYKNLLSLTLESLLTVDLSFLNLQNSLRKLPITLSLRGCIPRWDVCMNIYVYVWGGAGSVSLITNNKGTWRSWWKMKTEVHFGAKIFEIFVHNCSSKEYEHACQVKMHTCQKALLK